MNSRRGRGGWVVFRDGKEKGARWVVFWYVTETGAWWVFGWVGRWFGD
jgi:hypothetical protein